MQIRHMPKVNARYWAAISLASLFGTNLGDLYAHDSGFGLIGGVPILAALAALVFLVERRDATSRELYYWLVIIIIRTGATNIADYLKHKMSYPVFGLILTLLLAGFAWASLRGGERQARTEDARGMPRTGTSYWATMLSAGVFGTFFGDVAQHLIGQGQASMALGVLLTGALAVWKIGGAGRFWLYWIVVAVARTSGTAMGDWLAENDALSIGLPVATLITGCAFAAVLLLWPRRRSGELAHAL